MKFIDYASYFMRNLPVTLNRFQTEGSEHMNYDHNCYYYSHTTRHGGTNNTEPLKAIFLNTWRQVCYQIEFESDNKFASWEILTLLWFECRISENYQLCERLAVAKKKHKKNWWHMVVIWLLPPYQKKIQNVKIATRLLSSSVPADAVADEAAVFAGTNFIPCGTGPRSKGKKLTRSQVEQIIVNNGGRIKKTIPGRVKGRSTKRYIILFEKPKNGKVPSLITSAITCGYKIVSYSYVFNSISSSTKINPDAYNVDLYEYAKTYLWNCHRIKYILQRKERYCLPKGVSVRGCFANLPNDSLIFKKSKYCCFLCTEENISATKIKNDFQGKSPWNLYETVESIAM